MGESVILLVISTSLLTCFSAAIFFGIAMCISGYDLLHTGGSYSTDCNSSHDETIHPKKSKCELSNRPTIG